MNSNIETSKKLKNANELLKAGNFQGALNIYNSLKNSNLNSIAEKNIELISKKFEIRMNTNTEKLSTNVFVGIAAIPDRVNALEKTIGSLLPQVEKIGVYLNNWTGVPDFLRNDKIIVRGVNEPDLGDVGKFFWLDDHDGIYFSCDDDLIYPPDYISRTVNKLKEHNFNSAIGWHGSLIKEPFETYYNKNSRRVFVFHAHRPHDTPVHILGTGCSAFHTSKLKIKKSDFKHPNMADIFFSEKGQEQKIPFYVIAHEKNEITEVEGAQESSIFKHSHDNVRSVKNTKEIQNTYVKNNYPWVMNDFRSLSILIVGRFENYSKGGIYKSCHLIQKHLSINEHNVEILDTQKEITPQNCRNIDMAWIYPGDPERPDFKSVEEKIDILRKNGVPVIVNLSYLYKESRTLWIKQKLLELNSDNLPPVLGAVFTESAANDPLLKDVREYLCVVPKTLLPTKFDKVLGFDEREGICLGDATKLANPDIIGGSINPWIDAISNRLPHVNLYAYKQYQGKNPHSKVIYVPHMNESFGEWLGNRKLFICANVHLTFEMVACESQSYGTPIIYRHMPHSLSEYISATGMSVRTPGEMGEMVAWLYNDKRSWEKFSQSSIHNANSKNIDLLDASLEGYLRLALYRIKNIIKSKNK